MGGSPSERRWGHRGRRCAGTRPGGAAPRGFDAAPCPPRPRQASPPHPAPHPFRGPREDPYVPLKAPVSSTQGSGPAEPFHPKGSGSPLSRAVQESPPCFASGGSPSGSPPATSAWVASVTPSADRALSRPMAATLGDVAVRYWRDSRRNGHRGCLAMEGWSDFVPKGEAMYVPSDGPADRFVPEPGGLHRLHLVEYEGGLRLREDETGLFVGPTDRRLQRAGLYVTNVRGVTYYPEAARRADLRPGRPLRLVPEPGNLHDPFAVAVRPNYGKESIGYVNKQKARQWSSLIAEGARLTAVSLRGTGPGEDCEAVAVLAAAPEVVAHLMSRLPTLPRPVHLL
ncbi:HIRAN domain-containing protein [Streptomyces sp. NPDC059456]|uniref:HIRAN domain-containing protein n=1 Tax=Streptomyces sp. NPDC059456 TaxID=3346838 RepID=UPI003679E99B